MAEKYGVEKSKLFLKAILYFGNAIGKSAEDGKISVLDLGNFVNVLPHIMPAIQAAKYLGPEIKDYSAEEKQILFVFVEKEFNIPQDIAEAVIEKAIQAMIHLSELILAFNKPK